MKNKGLNLIVFILGLFSFIISAKLFYNSGIYVDEANISPSVVLGGEFWLWLDWIRLALLVLICLISGIQLFQKTE